MYNPQVQVAICHPISRLHTYLTHDPKPVTFITSTTIPTRYFNNPCSFGIYIRLPINSDCISFIFTTYYLFYLQAFETCNPIQSQDMEASNSLAQNTILMMLLLYTASTITFISALPKTNVEFIKSSCSCTTYPTLCVNSLSTRAGAIQTSPKLLAQTALSVTLDTTRSTSAAIVKLSKRHGMTPLEVAAMKDCIELLGDSVYELENSLEEMSRPGSKSSGLVISDIQTWVSAAMTDEDTCIEGFGDTKMKKVVRGKIVNVAHLTSNALALINSYAASSKQVVN